MEEAEIRKVQISGGSTFIVSLPKQWARGHGVKNGDPMALIARPDGSLSVMPGQLRRQESAPFPIDATKLDGADLLRALIGSYMSGQDALLIRAQPRLTPSQRETIRRFTRICIGPEIIEETGEQVLVRDLVNPTEFTLRNALSRLQLMTHSMIQDAVHALRDQDLETAKDVQSRDDEVDRLHRLIAKRFAKMLTGVSGSRDADLTLLEALHIHQVSRLLERCADHATNVAAQSEQLKAKPIKPEDLNRIVRLGERALDLLSRAYTAFRRADVKAANKVVDDSGQLERERERLRETVFRYGPQYASTLALLIESLERIHQYAADIAEITLNVLHVEPAGKRGAGETQ